MTKLTKFVSLTLLIAICSIECMAQETVSGTVLDYYDQPMQGVTVEIVGRSERTITDIDGIFKIEVPTNVSKIRLSYPGVKPHEFKVTPNMEINYGKNVVYGKFRGFINFYGGVALSEKIDIGSVTDIHPGFTWGCDFSFGGQLTRQIYLGGGFGTRLQPITGVVDYQGPSKKYTLLKGGSFPVFANIRWDRNLEKSVSPFADLKLGYQFCPNGYSRDSSFEIKRCSSLYVEPSIGVRFKVERLMGICLGVSYSVLKPYKFNDEKRYNASSLSLNVAIDMHRWHSWK